MKKVDSGAAQPPLFPEKRVTAGEAVRTSPPKELVQSTRRLTALEERLSHLEQQLNLLLEELHGETDHGVP